ncbi:GntR family transcriptional regulator [Leptothrix discophora]|uniref:GntR family transcriptional regulator n=1 Tax=Leptothrix discophora TaxID=89 RepID=A0ABT9G4J2_LEPDI|nr:GntR family transcriptional regulator [Leptothrix discophora]MDP4301408.1 GntR family transcriptional regulator [Leptothrix discophora]
MKQLTAQPNLVDQVRDAILQEIASGALPPGERVVQERIAESLGVSRQPVQQALALLLSQGVLRDAPGRRLIVAPLDPQYVRQMYDMRAVIEGMAFGQAAQRNADRAGKLGPALVEAGRKAVASGSVPRMIAADMKFHGFIHELSGNTLVAPTLAPHLTYMQRVMGQVLLRDDKPRDIWQEHERMLEAVASGNAALAEGLAREHITAAANFMVARLEAGDLPAAA